MNFITVLAGAFHDRSSVTSAELQQVLGVSRQAIWRHVRRLIETGALVAESAGRGTRYRPGPRMLLPASSLLDARPFWSELARRFPDFTHVQVQLVARGLSRKADAELLIQALPRRAMVVFDLERVERVGEAFARHLLFVAPRYLGFEAVAINAGTEVGRTIARVAELEPARWRGRG